MNPSPISRDSVLGVYSVFTVFSEDAPAWPYYFDLYSSNRNDSVSVSITVSAYHLSKAFLSFQNRERLDYLIFGDGIILLTNQKSDYFKNIEEIYPALLSAASASETLVEYGEYYVFESSADKYGFRMISLVPQSVYDTQLHGVLTQLLLNGACLIFVAILITVFLTYHFYKPVNETVQLLRTYIPDDLENYENELAFIEKSISRYASVNTNLNAALAKIQDAQAAVLQHQINSHFLFNTLENIKAISIEELGVENEVEESIALLNNLLRESIQNRTAIVPLSQEIHLTKSYLSLMQLRFPGVAVEWSVEERLLSCRVFKFSMQPILENCFIHAFKDRYGHENKITISVQPSANQTFTIHISDNGRGIAPDALAAIQQSLLSTNAVTGSHVGIRNVQNRIHTAFGENYGIRLCSTSEETTVDICYPITISEQDT